MNRFNSELSVKLQAMFFPDQKFNNMRESITIFVVLFCHPILIKIVYFWCHERSGEKLKSRLTAYFNGRLWIGLLTAPHNKKGLKICHAEAWKEARKKQPHVSNFKMLKTRLSFEIRD